MVMWHQCNDYIPLAQESSAMLPDGFSIGYIWLGARLPHAFLYYKWWKAAGKEASNSPSTGVVTYMYRVEVFATGIKIESSN